jgi:hypothetical protein
MIEGSFDVVFRGQIVKSFEQSTVETNLVQLFKSTPEAVSRLFSGKEVVIRKNLDYSAAMKYQSALKNAGALALIKEIEQAKPGSMGEQRQTVEDKTIEREASNFSSEPKAEVTQEAEQKQNNQDNATTRSNLDSSDDSLSIAAPGAQILPEKVYEQREVDTSSLTLAGVGERILPNKPAEQYKQPKTDHLSLEN